MPDRRSLADRFWDLPGFAWLADDFLTACLSYLTIALMLALTGLVIYVAAR